MQTLNIRENIKPLVVKALNKADTIKEAAKLLGLRSERTLFNYMREYNIKRTYYKAFDPKIKIHDN